MSENQKNKFIEISIEIAFVIMMAFLIIIPIYIAITYKSISDTRWVGYIGSAYVLIAVLTLYISARFFIKLISAKNCSPRQYEMLKGRLAYLKGIYDADNEPPQEPIEESKAAHIKGIQKQLIALEKYIDGKDSNLKWLSLTGYIEAWRKLHRVEEDITMIEEKGDLIYTALRCREKISGTKIEDKLTIENDIAKAIRIIDPTMDFVQCQTGSPSTGCRAQEVMKTVNKPEPSDTEKEAARQIIRFSRRKINEAKDNNWQSILQLCNLLTISLFLIVIITYVLLLIAIRSSILLEGIIGFYLIGAIAGLCGRFYGELKQETLTDDYGLSTRRLVATPFIAGLAAIGGVLFASHVSSPSAPFAPSDAFSLTLEHLFFAAAFGYSPNWIMQILQAKVEEYKPKNKDD